MMEGHKKILTVSKIFLIVILVFSLPMAVLGAGKTKMGKKGPMKPLKPGVYKIEDILKRGLDHKIKGFNYSVIAQAKTGSVELFQLDDVATHYHPKETHFLYILKGKAKGKIGDLEAEVGPGDLVVIPAGKKFQHSLMKIGDEPVVFLVFSTPHFRAKDIVWVEK